MQNNQVPNLSSERLLKQQELRTIWENNENRWFWNSWDIWFDKGFEKT